MKIRKILAQMFCEHQYAIEKWHWCHGQVGADPAFIEGFLVCPKCGKVKYFWADRGSELEKAILDKAAETPEEKRRKKICEAAGVSEIVEVSDGFHTFGDLYEQRTILFAALLRGHPDKAWKTRFDSVGVSSEGWFIAGVDTPEGLFTYHCEEKYWPLFECQEIPMARFDGHTAKDVYRLLSLPTFEAAFNAVEDRRIEATFNAAHPEMAHTRARLKAAWEEEQKGENK